MQEIKVVQVPCTSHSDRIFSDFSVDTIYFGNYDYNLFRSTATNTTSIFYVELILEVFDNLPTKQRQRGQTKVKKDMW